MKEFGTYPSPGNHPCPLSVTKRIRTETAHRLINYNGKCSHLHGHSYLWEVTIGRSGLVDNCLDNSGMLMDFKDLKQICQDIIGPLDHALVLHREDPLVRGFSEPDRKNLFRATNGEDPRLFLWDDNPTAESFAIWAATTIQKQFDLLLQINGNSKQLDMFLPPDEKGNLVVEMVRVQETENSYAEWIMV